MFKAIALPHAKNITAAFFITLVFSSVLFFMMPRPAHAQTDEPTRESLIAQIELLTQLLNLYRLMLGIAADEANPPVVGEEVAEDMAEAEADGTQFCTVSAPSTATYGQYITVSWTAINSTYVRFGSNSSGESLPLPEGNQNTNGTVTIPANAYGEQDIRLTAYGTGGSGSCVTTVSIPEPDDEETGTLKVYENGSVVLEDDDVTERYAISYCQTYASQRTTKTIRCTWNNDEVYYYAPTVTPTGQVTSCSVTLLPSVVRVGEEYVVSVSSLNSNYTTLTGQGASYSRGQSFDSVRVTATQAGTFRYNATAVRTDASGNPAYTATCAGTVVVQEATQTAPSAAAPYCTVSAIPYQTETGRKYTIQWDSTNAEYVLLDGKRMNADGFTSFSKSSAGTYTHTVKAMNGSQMGVCSAAVTIIALPQTFEGSATVSMTSKSNEQLTVSYQNIPYYSYIALYNNDDGKRYDVNDAYVGGNGTVTIYLNNNRPSGDYYLRVTREAPPANDSLYSEVTKSSSFSLTSGTNSAAITCSLAESDDSTLRWTSAGADYAVMSWKTAPQQYHAYHTEIEAQGEMAAPQTAANTEYRFVFYNYQNQIAACLHTID